MLFQPTTDHNISYSPYEKKVYFLCVCVFVCTWEKRVNCARSLYSRVLSFSFFSFFFSLFFHLCRALFVCFCFVQPVCFPIICVCVCVCVQANLYVCAAGKVISKYSMQLAVICRHDPKNVRRK
eukprot:TRINITY_DN5849_c1_g3_i1.p1 TRINITY_DN5849_c1_g3~~TRINITY_DN5849_c1_g3_i1.p1  ORF type:complete len:124 (-),score=4.77 TRINITY_DN5849_c1_g3_i1:22-393(-)